ncbi:glycosyltransferase [Clostridium felsineum]|uniref:glycosyltransferase n=1 Tax=Clostridium felsineum TaxID=36839 RepID=UPI00214DE8F9|nr:glycosyltransferase [Clostridium felsineum]MCR3757801.1 glycosyltransferase [Clostridium felsineum]
MNILHITTFLQGGAGRIITDLAIYEKRKGNNVFIVCNDKEETGYINYDEYLKKLKDMNINVYRVNSTFKRDIYLNINAVSFVRKVILEKNIDIIHTHAAVPSFIAINAREGISNRYIPVLQTMHGWGRNKRAEQENMDITIIKELDKLITVSKSDRNFMIKEGINEKLIDVIYNGVEDKVYEDNICDEITEDIDKYKRNGYKILGMIGTVCERKNQILLIEAFKNINKKVFCPIIGDGKLISELKEKCVKLGFSDSIKFYGYREDASKYLKYFDYQIVTSLSEGFGIVIVESFREKTPVIVSDIEVFRELICDRENGYLFESNNKASLADIVNNVLDKKYERKESITNKAYEYYNNSFKIGKMFFNYDREYNKLLDKSKKYEVVI